VVDVLVEHKDGHEQEGAYVLEPEFTGLARSLPDHKVVVVELDVYCPCRVWRDPLPTMFQIRSQPSDVGHGVAAILWHGYWLV
jgi:hypothetical protein